MTTLMHAHKEWASRPADERFVSLHDLDNHCQSLHNRSRDGIVGTRSISLEPVEGDQRALVARGPQGNTVELTHWSFGQLCQRAGAPAGYLRSLPAALAADNVNFGLQVSRADEQVKILLAKNGVAELRAVTGPDYGRVWNSTITRALVERFGDGITGKWTVPGEFGKKVAITKDNTTLFAGDRDMFVFLCDEANRIQLPNRRNGSTGSLARGFFVWNSEVGAAKLGIATFLFDYVCSNRIVWGAEDVKEISIRHSKYAPERFVDAVVPAIEQYASSSARGINETLLAAQKRKVDDVDAFLKSRKFSMSDIAATKAAHMADEQRPMETIWDVVTGITARARNFANQDDRVHLEREAGKVLDLVK